MRLRLLSVGLMISLLFAAESQAAKAKKADPPYEPTRGYKEKSYPVTDIPGWVLEASTNLVAAEYELGTTIDDQLFLGEIPGGAVYGYTESQYEAARRFFAETDFTTQGIMGTGTSSTHRYDPKQGNRVMTLFYNVLLGPGRSGAIGGQLDYRLKAIATPIVGWRQGVLLTRVNRVLQDRPDTRPVSASFSTMDNGMIVRPFVGGSFQRSGDFTFNAPVIGVNAFKVFHNVHYTFTFNPKDRTVDVASGIENRRTVIGIYAFMGESMQPQSHGIYAAGIQLGERGLFGRLGYINMNRFDRGTDVPDRLARGPNGGVGYSASLSSAMTLDACLNFGPSFTSSTSDRQGDWFGHPGLTVVLGRNF